jgi:hypothetical protein
MRPCVRVLALGAIATLLAPAAVEGHAGRAAGKVGLVTTSQKAYGFSSPDASWMSVTLDGPPQVSLAATWIGYVRTARSIYAYNSTNNHWYSSTYRGLPLGEAASVSTAVLWTTAGCYGISNLWALWKPQIFFGLMEIVRGGGSAGTFALVWTSRAVYVYNPVTGLWISRPLGTAPQGAIVLDGLGLVWLADGAVAYCPSQGAFVPASIPDAQGVSASGEGGIGLIWSDRHAEAYNNGSGLWAPIETDQTIEGGTAAGDVALLWTSSRAYAYSVSTGSWSYVLTQGALDKEDASGRSGPSVFDVSPNPGRAGEMTFRIPDGGRWKIEIFDLSGQRIRGIGEEWAGAGSTVAWDGRNDDGRMVAAGSYWVRAESGLRAEVRRIVVLP